MAVIPTIITAVIAFTATNIDDIFIMMMFFSQTNNSFRRRHVIVGQYLGFIALLAISSLGFLGSYIIPKEFIGLLGFVPIVIGIRKFSNNENETKPATYATSAQKTPSILGILLNPKTYSVAAVTFANGGDNIGIYTPLFASMNLKGLIVTLITFLLLVILWCLIGIQLTRQKSVAQVLSRYGHIIFPIVLISLGIYIIIENGTLRLFGF